MVSIGNCWINIISRVEFSLNLIRVTSVLFILQILISIETKMQLSLTLFTFGQRKMKRLLLLFLLGILGKPTKTPKSRCPSTASHKNNHIMLQAEINKLAYLIEDMGKKDKFAGAHFKKGLSV